MAEAPAGGAGGAKQDPQALIAKHAAVTQSGSAGDAAIVSRVEASIKNSPMGWLQGVLGETSGRATAEQGEVHGKLAEHQDLVAKSSKDAPKDAGPPPAPGPAAHPAVPQPAAAGAKAAVVAPQPAAGGAAAEHAPIAGHAPAKSGAPSTPAAAPAPTVASAVAGAGNDAQLDGMLNGYTPKSPQTTQTLGRIKQMGDVASGFSGQLDVYVSQGGAIDSTIAGASNFLGVGKEAGAVWRNNPYRKVHGVLGGIMTGMSAVKNVCSMVGSVCGKLGMVLTVIGLLGMIFPPIGAAVSGIARILNVVGMICDAISFVLSGILTGLNGVVLAQQIAAGASAEEKAASADLMMSEANEAASGFVNLAMVFGPKFMKGMLGSSKGIVASLIKRAKATIGRISLKVSSNVSHFANKIVRKLGFGGSNMARVGGEWKNTGMIAGMKEKWAGSKVGKVFNGAPQHIEAVQEKLMAKYGNTTWAKNMDRVGMWGGSVAHRFDLEEKVGKMGESSGKFAGGLGADTTLGKSLAASAERSELQTRELTMKMEARDASHLEETRWRNELNRSQAANPDHIRDKGVENKFVNQQGDRVRNEADTNFKREEQQREVKERLEQRRTDRFDRRNDEFYENGTNPVTGKSSRDEMMGSVHNTRDKRWKLESDLKPQETERRELLAKTTKSAEDQTRLTALNSELRPLDEARRVNKMHETDLSGLAAGSERARKPEYHNWHDVGSNAWEATAPVLEMAHLKDQDSAWSVAEKANLKKQTKYSKGAAQGDAAGRGGHGTFREIGADARHRELNDLTAFVRSAPLSTTLSGRVGSMLSPITSRVQPAPAAPASAAPATQLATPAPSPTTAPAPGGVSVQPMTAAAPTEHKEGDPGTTVALAAQVHEAPASPPVVHEDPAAAGGEPDADGGEALPYWPALLPEFDQAQKDFGWMRKVAVEFKHAQIDGKQKAVDTLAVYGRYKEYSALRWAAAKKNQAGAAETGQATAANVGHAAQTEGQAGQGEAKQGEAKGAANDKAATDLPEPESRGFWDRILGAVKRWAKNKAAQVFGWIQEKIASVIMKGLCGVSMGDMREYAGALRHQQQAAHGVANEAGATSGAAATSSIKLASDATKEAQGAADAIGECDKNIVDADTFMSDIASFESQLAEEKANAQIFISQVQASAHAEQARKKAEAEQQAAEEAKEQQRAAQLGGGATTPAAAAPTPTPTPAPAPTAEPAHAPPVSPEGEADAGQIHAAADYVASESDAMTSRLDARADDYTNQLALALTNRTGKGADGVDLKGPAKKESKHIVEEFKKEAAHSRTDMESFHTIPIEASQAKRIAEQIITVAQHLESSYAQSENALDELFARTYNGIKDGKRSLKSQALDGDNVVSSVNHAGDDLDNKVIDTSLPVMNTAWNTVSKPIQAPSAPAPTSPTPAPTATEIMIDESRMDLPPRYGVSVLDPIPPPVIVADNAPPKSQASIQRKSDGQATASDPSAVATAGVASANSRLPHQDQIQASFGRHDISHVRAQTGGGAAEASHGLGASAYAVGDRVGFAKSPDLHTAAHEAAHVVQQQAGVHLKGGIDGGKGDPHEQHADAVADKVVRGESAEGLLDTMGPKRGGGDSAVQRKEAKDTADGEHTTTNHDFVRENFLKLIGAIMDRVEATPLTQPHPRLGWRSDTAKEHIALAISTHLRAADPSVGLARMSQLVHPANLEAMIDQVRRGPQGSRFQEVSIAIGTAFDRPLVSSIARMGARAIVQWDNNHGKPVDASMLVVSSPLDRVIGELLLHPEVVVYKAKGKGDDTGAKPFEKPLQMVSGEWQGAKDEKLWNWIKVTSPKNATVEDVANTFAGEYGSAQEAYRFAASPPFFGLPIDVALHTDGAREHAPADATAKPKHPDAVVVAAPDALAKSAASDDAAIAQAPAATHADKPAPDTLKRIALQLNFIDGVVAPWGANGPLAAAEEFAARRHKEFEADKKSTSKWTSVLSLQEQTLFATSSELSAFLEDLEKTKATPKDKAGLGPVMRVIEAYVRTAAVSHLGAQSNAALIDARRSKALLPLELAQQQINVARGSVAEQRTQEKDVTDLEPNAASTPSAVADQMQRAADLQLKAAHGEKLDPAAVDELGVDASETAIRAKLVTLGTQAHNVMRKADEVGVDKGKSPYGSWSVHMVCEDMLKKINGSSTQVNTDKNDHIAGGWHAMLDSAHTLGSSAKDARSGKEKILDQRRDAIKRVTTLLTTYKDQLNLEEFLKWAYQDISDAMLRSLLKDMAIQIGVAVVTGEIIGAGFAAVRGIALAGEIGSEIREAGLLYKGAELLATAAANTGVQGAMGGEMNRQALAENALAMVLTSAALRPFQGLLHDSAAVEGEIRTWGQGAGKVGKVAAELVIDTGASIGAAGVAHAVTHGGQMDEQSAQSWVTMGLTIAAQRFVHQRTQAMQHRIVEAKRELATKDPGLDVLFKKSVALEHRANAKGDKVPPEEAIALLVERRTLLVEERDLYSKNPKASKQLLETKADLDKTGPQFMEVPLQLSHLSPVVEGHIYEGSSTQVHDAFAAADKMGVVIAREWLANESKWRLRSGDRTIEIIEKGSHSVANETAHSMKTGGDVTSHEALAPHDETSSPEKTQNDNAAEAKSRAAVDSTTVDAATGAIGVTFQGRGDRIARLAQRLKPEPGYFDVVVHGDGRTFAVLHDGTWVKITPNSVRKYIRTNGVHQGQPIRLLSCEAGAEGAVTAQAIADGLGVRVIAPTEKIWLSEDKTTGAVDLLIGNDPKKPSGGWRHFEPHNSKTAEAPQHESNVPVHERPTARMTAQPDPTAEHPVKSERPSEENVSLSKPLPTMSEAEQQKLSAVVEKQVDRIRDEHVQGATTASKQAVQDAAYTAAEKTYRERRRDGQPEAGARKAGSDAGKLAADEAWTVQAKKLAVDKANELIDTGAVFDRSTMSEPAKEQLDSYRRGSTKEGGAARKYSTALTGAMSLPDMERVLEPEVKTGAAARSPEEIKGPPPTGKQTQLAYYFVDGTVIRLKPHGDEFNGWQPSYSVELKTTPVQAGPSDPSQIAFKVDGRGRAVPKDPDQIANPYVDGKYLDQRHAYQQHVLDAGHRAAK